jgi:hypothetical protein
LQASETVLKGYQVLNMPKRVLPTLILALSLSAAMAAPGAAQDFFKKKPPHWPKPIPAPEFDSKLLIAGSAVTAGSIALLIERRRRRRADHSPDEG